MKLISTQIPEVKILQTEQFFDKRGFFSEVFSKKFLDISFVQDNESYSTYGVLRGLHYQRPPFAQAKLVRCVKGSILDVVVDIRKGSPTFRKNVSVVLSDENRLQLFVPKGFAHGFVVLSPDALVHYKCDEYYHPEAAEGIHPLDPSLGIDWIITETDMTIKDDDLRSPCLDDCTLHFNL